jgi:hypothetical protein
MEESSQQKGLEGAVQGLDGHNAMHWSQDTHQDQCFNCHNTEHSVLEQMLPWSMSSVQNSSPLGYVHHTSLSLSWHCPFSETLPFITLPNLSEDILSKAMFPD